MTDSIERTAILSGDGVYRYRLARRWSDGEQVYQRFFRCSGFTSKLISVSPNIPLIVKWTRQLDPLQLEFRTTPIVPAGTS